MFHSTLMGKSYLLQVKVEICCCFFILFVAFQSHSKIKFNELHHLYEEDFKEPKSSIQSILLKEGF